MAEIGKVPCGACGFDRARVVEGKGGTLSIKCSECSALTFVKSPNAVAALRARLAKAAPAPTEEKKGGGKTDLWNAI